MEGKRESGSGKLAGKMSNNYDQTSNSGIEKKLHLFVNKYYRIKILQGLGISTAAGLIVILCLIALGNVFNPSGFTLLISKIAGYIIWIYIVIKQLLVPILRRFGIIKGLNFKEASNIISQKHRSIEDKIINIIELSREKAGKNNILYDFAIDQKADSISQFDFNTAISVNGLIKIVLRCIGIIGLAVVVFLAWPGFVKNGIRSVWTSESQINKINTLTIKLLNDSLSVESGKDFLLKFAVESYMPIEQVTIQFGSNKETAKKNGSDYEYLFQGVNTDIDFIINCDGTLSEKFVLKTLEKPEIGTLKLKVIPPAYTNLETTVVDGDGNAEIPAGSNVFWSIKTVNTNQLIWIDTHDSTRIEGQNNLWDVHKIILKNLNYEIICKNDDGLFTTYDYKIAIVSDLFPTIDISESKDSTISENVYIQGVIQDDYGFSKLEVIANKGNKEFIKEIPIKKNNIYESFYYTIIPDSLVTDFVFRIWDNDLTNGPKYTDSRKITLKSITRAERENKNKALADSIKQNVNEGISAVEKLEKKISEFKMDQVAGDLKPWEIQEKIKELSNLKENVLQFLESVKEDNKEYTENESVLNQDKELTEKAKQIQELMENLLDDELKELLKQFDEMAKDFNSKKADELTEKMNMDLEKLKEQMEMNLELLRKYDLEKELMKQVEQLNQMADSLATNNKNDGNSEKIKEDYQKWDDNYKKNFEENIEFKKPLKLDELSKEREETKRAINEWNESKSDRNKENAKSSASKSMKKLAKKMEDMLNVVSREGQFVDLEDIRQIRNALNDFSKKQEEINGSLSSMLYNNSAVSSIMKEQKELDEKFHDISDSLKSIGYKQPMIAKIVGEELFHVETSFKNLFNSFDGNKMSIVRIEQNKIMSEINSIAIKLDELIRSMQNAKGSGSGDKGFTDRKKKNDGEKSGSEKLGDTGSMQQSLKEQLKSAIQKMKEGSAGKKNSEGMAKMLGEREMMRKAMEKLLQEGSLGKEARQKANEALNMMKEVEKDIIYNRLNDQTIDKDNLIKTKLLEAESAERERENENKRESKEFKGNFGPNGNTHSATEAKEKNAEQVIKYNELKLKKFYQEKYLKYLESTKK